MGDADREGGGRGRRRWGRDGGRGWLWGWCWPHLGVGTGTIWRMRTGLGSPRRAHLLPPDLPSDADPLSLPQSRPRGRIRCCPAGPASGCLTPTKLPSTTPASCSAGGCSSTRRGSSRLRTARNRELPHRGRGVVAIRARQGLAGFRLGMARISPCPSARPSDNQSHLANS